MKEIYLSLNEAITESAKQNFNHDVRNGVVERRDWQESESIYLREAEEILRSTGSNYIPERHEVWIKLKQ